MLVWSDAIVQHWLVAKPCGRSLPVHAETQSRSLRVERPCWGCQQETSPVLSCTLSPSCISEDVVAFGEDAVVLSSGLWGQWLPKACDPIQRWQHPFHRCRCRTFRTRRRLPRAPSRFAHCASPRMWELWKHTPLAAHFVTMQLPSPTAMRRTEGLLRCPSCSNGVQVCGWLPPSAGSELWLVHLPSTIRHPVVWGHVEVLSACPTSWGETFAEILGQA